MNFPVWALLEKNAGDKPHQSVEALKRSLVKAWDKIPQSTLRAIISDVPQSFKAVIENNGGPFEN